MTLLEHAPEYSARAGRREKARLRRELAAELRRKDREKLRTLREAIRAAQQKRRELVKGAVERCRAERARLRQNYRTRKAQLLAELKAERAREKQLARDRCRARKRGARAEGTTALGVAESTFRNERAFMRELRRAELDAKARQRELRRSSSAAERRAESDDEVRANLSPELVPVFNRVRGSIRPSRRASRTEVFLRWAEEHPDEVIAFEAERADREVAELVREHQKHQRAMRTRARYRRPETALSEVPF